MKNLSAASLLLMLCVSCQPETPNTDKAPVLETTSEEQRRRILNNTAPIVNAGADIKVTDLDKSGTELVRLNGKAYDEQNNITEYRVLNKLGRVLVSGRLPGTFTKSLSLSVGIHELTFEAIDTLKAKGTDTMLVEVLSGASTPVPVVNPTPAPVVVVSPAPINTAPEVSAGDDQTITAPAGANILAVALKGSAKDAQNNITYYAVLNGDQILVSGPNSSVFTSTLELRVDWTQTLTFEARDAFNLVARDTVVISVLKAPTTPVVVVTPTPAPAPVVTLPPVTNPGFCSNEGSRCQFSGIWTIRYGAAQSWVRKTLTPDASGGVLCDNSVFGDPLMGTAKTCELLAAGIAPNTAPRVIAGDNVTLTDADKNGAESMSLKGSASDSENNIISYRVLINGDVLLTGSDASILNRLITANIGAHNITLEAYDVDGLKGSASLTFTVIAAPVSPPVVVVTPPPVVTPSLPTSPSSEADVDLTPYITPYMGAIKNPYYSVRNWPVLNVDQSSNHFYIFSMWDSANAQVVDRRWDSTPEAQRLFPVPVGSYDPNAYRSNYIRLIRPGEGAIQSSGNWDDVYKSLDDNHTGAGGWVENYRYDGVNPNNNAQAPAEQMLRLQGDKVNWITTAQGSPVNFSSMSYSGMGHGITSIWNQDTTTEQQYFFRSWVRATPGYLSYVDTHAEEAADNYLGLFAHSFQSIGRSGSEVNALSKMIMAGAYLDRDLKDLLKVNGHYSGHLLSMFRQSLPYVDADGNELPPENELFHRPVYSSSGNDVSPEYVDSNYGYHGYNDGLHVYRMAHRASNMSTPAPVVVTQTNNIRIYNGASIVEDLRVNSWGTFSATESTVNSSKTITTIVAKDNRKVEVFVDLKDSIDLLGRPLTFSIKPIYFNQSHVINIEKLATNHELNANQSGQFYRLSFSYDARLPRTRISVGIFAHNGVHVSLPAFINVIYMGDALVQDTYNHMAYYYPPALDDSFVPWGNSSDPLRAKNRNKRPLIAASNGLRINVPKNQAFRLPLVCTDPEGFPTRIYKWMNQIGRYDQATRELVFRADELSADRLESIHVICSDGTAGYSAVTVKLAVGSAVDETRGAINCGSETCTLPDTGRYQIFHGRLENPHYPYLSKIFSGVSSVACNEQTFGNPGTWTWNFCYYKRID